MTKTNILPPCRAKLGIKYLLLDGTDVTAWDIVREFAGEDRRWSKIGTEVERDLLRFAASKVTPVHVGVKAGNVPFFYFRPDMALEWLNTGGRAWIITELEALASKRVVAFPGNGRRT